MKQARRIICVVLVICMFAASIAMATPSASIVSPNANSIVADDNLLISVKVSDKKKVAVSVFEEKEIVAAPTEESPENLEFVTIDTKDFTEDILKSISEAFEKTYKNTVFSIGEKENLKSFIDSVVAEPSYYTAVGETGAYSKKLEKLTPGLYRVQVEVLDKDEKVVETYNSFVAVQEKVDATKKTEAAAVTTEVQKTSLVQSLIKFVKNIIK